MNPPEPRPPQNVALVEPGIYPRAQVTCIRAGLASNADIRRRSQISVQVDSDFTNNAFGVRQMRKPCPVCHKAAPNCGGHSGHLELPLPVWRVFQLSRLADLLNCICFHCQKLRLDILPDPPPEATEREIQKRKLARQALEQLEKLPPEQRFEHAVAATQQHIEKRLKLERCDHCQTTFPNFKPNSEHPHRLHIVWPLSEADMLAYNEDRAHWKPPTMDPRDLAHCLTQIPDRVTQLLGCGPRQTPDALVFRAFPLGSVLTRPDYDFGDAAAAASSSRSRHRDHSRAWTAQYRGILEAANQLKDLLKRHPDKRLNLLTYRCNHAQSTDHREAFTYAFVTAEQGRSCTRQLKQREAKRYKEPLEKAWDLLNARIAAFHSMKVLKANTKNTRQFGGLPRNWTQTIKGSKGGGKAQANNKQSRVRCNIASRRLGQGLRVVLNGNIHILLDEVLIPICEAKNVSRRVPINPLNFRDVRRWLVNGPHRHVGSLAVVLHDGTRLDLKAMQGDRRDIQVHNLMFIERHIQNGDYALVNRPPTLHRGSTMSYRIKVHEHFILVMHPASFPNFAADADGDELQIFPVDDLRAESELKHLAIMHRNFCRDGKLWFKFIQHSILGAYKLTEGPLQLTRAEFLRFANIIPAQHPRLRTDLEPRPSRLPTDLEPRHQDYSKKEYDGYDVLSLLLPADYSYNHDNLCIRHGRMLSGILNEHSLNGPSGLVISLYRDYPDPQVAMDFVYYGYLLFQEVCNQFGFSISLDDQSLPETYSNHFKTHFPQILHEATTYADRTANQNYQHHPKLDNQQAALVEDNIRAHANRLFQQATELVRADLEAHPENTLVTMMKAGVKIQPGLLCQLAGCLGQILVLQSRLTGRSGYFKPDSTRHLQKHGFATSALSQGLTPSEVVMQSVQAMGNIAEKNLGTSRSGHQNRKEFNCLQGLTIDRNDRVVNTQNKLLWTHYGEDGWDPALLVTQAVPTQAPPNPLPLELQAWNHLEAQLLQLGTKPGGHTQAPIPFKHLMASLEVADTHPTDQSRPLTPMQAWTFQQELLRRLIQDKLVPREHLYFRRLFQYHCNTHWLAQHGWPSLWAKLAHRIWQYCRRARMEPGESVGALAAQCHGEPQTQLLLKQPHGNGSTKFSGGDGALRVTQIINGSCQAPMLQIVMREGGTEEDAYRVGYRLVETYLSDLCTRYPIIDARWTLHIFLEREKLLQRHLSPRRVVMRLHQALQKPGHGKLHGPQWSAWTAPFWDETPNNPILHVKLALLNTTYTSMPPDKFVTQIFHQTLVGGHRRMVCFVVERRFHEQRWSLNVLVEKPKPPRTLPKPLLRCLPTLLNWPEVDPHHTTTNHFEVVAKVWGLYAARQGIIQELTNLMGDHTDRRHLELMARAMTVNGCIEGFQINRYGRRLPPLQQHAFENFVEGLHRTCENAQVDHLKTVAGAAFANQPFRAGTNYALKLRMTPQEQWTTESWKRTLQQAQQQYRFTPYVVSPKVDGLRVYLVFLQHTWFLVDRTFQVVTPTHPLQLNRNPAATDTFDKPTHQHLQHVTQQTVPHLQQAVQHATLPLIFQQGCVLDAELVPVAPSRPITHPKPTRTAPDRSQSRPPCGVYVKRTKGPTPIRYTHQEDIHYHLLVFDCLTVSGRSVTQLRYEHRLTLAQRLFSLWPVQAIPHNIHWPKTYQLPSIQTKTLDTGKHLGAHILWINKPVFSGHLLLKFDQKVKPTLPWKTDGYVLTHTAAALRPHRFTPHSVLKWKPHLENTIDLQFQTSTQDPQTNSSTTLAVTSTQNQPQASRTLSRLPPWPKHLAHKAATELAKVQRFRCTYQPPHRRYPLYLPDGTLFTFAEWTQTLPNQEEPQHGEVYECKWSPQRYSWIMERKRLKKANTFETVLKTLTNLEEALTLQEVHQAFKP